MSKRTIAVTIDANAKTCGKCEHRHDEVWDLCAIFFEDAKDSRCPACLAAEKAYKEATRGKA